VVHLETEERIILKCFIVYEDKCSIKLGEDIEL
jgi:hypothetical protein